MKHLDLERLPRAFFQRDALVLARALIGTRIVVRGGTSVSSSGPSADLRIGRIVETEAYRGPTDLACHARVGLTKRTKTLLGPPAHAYVFLIYGMYDCFNVVGNAEGKGHAVLIRAVEPVHGIEAKVGTNGPGKLTRALGITRKDDALDLIADEARIFIAERERKPAQIGVSARVGVAYAGEWADRPWRFFDAGSDHVSRPPARSIGRPPSSS